MRAKGATGITRIINAATYSYQGLVACFKTEAAFRQELLTPGSDQINLLIIGDKRMIRRLI